MQHPAVTVRQFTGALEKAEAGIVLAHEVRDAIVQQAKDAGINVDVVKGILAYRAVRPGKKPDIGAVVDAYRKALGIAAEAVGSANPPLSRCENGSEATQEADHVTPLNPSVDPAADNRGNGVPPASAASSIGEAA